MEKTLEQEFAEYKEYHKYEMITAALIMCEEEDIYNNKLLSDYKGLKLKGDERAFYIIDDLYERAHEKDEYKLYDKIYQMCWKKIRNKIRDDKSYRINVNYDEEWCKHTELVKKNGAQNDI